MGHFLARCAAATVLALAVQSARTQEPSQSFAVQTVYNSPNGITALEFDHLGRMIAAEKQERVVVFLPDGSGGFQTPPQVFADLRPGVDTAGESGLLGLALDPDYANMRYVYLFHTTTTDQRLVRLTANAGFTATDPASLRVLLSGLPRAVSFHKAGDIHFSPADPASVFVALGDDGQRSAAQNLDLYQGKILRVDAGTGLGVPDSSLLHGRCGVGSLARLGAGPAESVPLRLPSQATRSSIRRRTATRPIVCRTSAWARTEPGARVATWAVSSTRRIRLIA